MLTDYFNLPCQVHASCVSVEGRGLLIIGASGSGKSALALQLLALGADLVADDRCDLSETPDAPIASRPASLPEAIEARGLGILAAPCVGPTKLLAVIDLDKVTDDRMPVENSVRIGQHVVPLLEMVTSSHLPAALLHFLKYGFHASMEK